MTYKADGVFCLEKFEAPTLVDDTNNNSFNITFGKKASSTKQNSIGINYTGHNASGTKQREEFETEKEIRKATRIMPTKTTNSIINAAVPRETLWPNLSSAM